VSGGAIVSRLGRPLVLGLAGGIGSGKSAAAKMLGELGCLVIDSDAEARAALEREDVQRTLRSWWGDGVFDATGSVDRKAVGAIVFSDAAERTRLEGLIHPLIKRRRSAMIEGAEDRVGVVVDAPLLFEAGIDGECDAVLFIDAPEEDRAARVRARGWEEGELARRESAQMPLEEKRDRSDAVVRNDADLATLGARVRDAFVMILERVEAREARRKGSGGGS